MEGQFLQSIPKTSSSKKIAAIAIFAVIGIAGAFFNLYSSQISSETLTQYKLLEEEFQDFIQKYNKKYSTDEEYQLRLKNYLENASFIRAHNSLNRPWTLGVNEFTDMTFQEFKRIYLPVPYEYSRNIHTESYENLEIPTSVDWRTKGAVTNVKTQGPCGSYYAFAATGSIESAWFIAGHTLTTLSEQEILDCSTSFGNHQCAGGITDAAFNFVISKGITSETLYPYLAQNGTCNTSKVSNVVAKISKYIGVRANNPTALMTAAAKQPVAVAVEASGYVWQNYRGGVVTKDCGTNLDHAVVIVGYKNEGTNPYWILKNSWGPDWGEKGYIRVKITSGEGLCGVNMVPSYPVAS